MMKNLELLSPAGNPEKLNTAFYFGADAAYIGGKNFSLRSLGDNFDYNQIKEAVAKAHSVGKKIYVTVNIFAKSSDFAPIKEYLAELERIGVDAVIASDLGIIDLVLSDYSKLDVHVSTQANTTNAYSAKFYKRLGVKRIVLARELSIDEIAEVNQQTGGEIELEAFVHGAMCIAYSGRCLLSNYFTGRQSNRGECVQACRWEYYLVEKNRKTDALEIVEDEKGTHILNSKDLNMIEHLDKLANAGVSSFKIEGRMKTPYYVATVTNAYRRALDILKSGGGYNLPQELIYELKKTSHRDFTTGFYFNSPEQCYETSRSITEYDFIAIVKDTGNGYSLIEQRNRFEKGDELEVLSPNDTFLKRIVVSKMTDESGREITVADKVQQKLRLYSDIPLKSGDILRKKIIKHK